MSSSQQPFAINVDCAFGVLAYGFRRAVISDLIDQNKEVLFGELAESLGPDSASLLTGGNRSTSGIEYDDKSPRTVRLTPASRDIESLLTIQ